MIDRMKFLFRSVMVLLLIALGLYAYYHIKGWPSVSLFGHTDQMEHTATVLRSIEQTNRWVFLTVEDEEVVYREHLTGDVAKIYPSTFELGIDLKSNPDWFTIADTENGKVATLWLPAITILNVHGINAVRVINVYGDATDAEKVEMQREAENRLMRRAYALSNIRQAQSNAETYFTRLFKALGCDAVQIEWLIDYDYER